MVKDNQQTGGCTDQRVSAKVKETEPSHLIPPHSITCRQADVGTQQMGMSIASNCAWDQLSLCLLLYCNKLAMFSSVSCSVQ